MVCWTTLQLHLQEYRRYGSILHCRDQNEVEIMPISENEGQVLQYSPPNEVEVSSTEKEH